MIALKIDAKLEGRLTGAFPNDMRNLANFLRLKNSDFIFESKLAVLNKNNNLKHLDQLDAVRKLYSLLW